MTAGSTIGFYGKLPTLGDFVGRRVPQSLLEPWDGWLQASLASSRESLGDTWLDLYLTSPMWRFLASPGALDARPVAGVMFPSVDRVGRCFPFTVFSQMPADSVGLIVADDCADWFDQVEQLVLAQFDETTLDLDEFDEALCSLAQPLDERLAMTRRQSGALDFPAYVDERISLLHVPLLEGARVGAAALTWFDWMLRTNLANCVQWWSSGSAHVRPSWLVTRGLPEPTGFRSMLTGQWREWPWDSCELETAGAAGTMQRGVHFESAGSTHPGKVRTENQDAYISRPDVGLWAVADGMGGHEQGQVASRLACDALANVEPRPAFAQLVNAVRSALQEANRYLYSMSLRPVNPVTSGTTVVAMLVRDGVGVCLWAGDSRLYRLRDGNLEQLTTDHSESATDDGATNGNAITRAVGGGEHLDLEQLSFSVQVGDRFLLCSDGLYRETTERELSDLLQTGDAMLAVESLQARVLQGRAADNVTSIVVDAQPGLAA